MPTNPTDGPVHQWFELSYSTYAVLPRTLMQSMPTEWQERIVACLEEARDAFEHLPQPEGYRVDAVRYKEASDLDPQEAKLANVDVEDTDDGTAYYFRGEAIEPDRVVCIPVVDPVPHYNRGRTYIEPRIAEAVAS